MAWSADKKMHTNEPATVHPRESRFARNTIASVVITCSWTYRLGFFCVLAGGIEEKMFDDRI